MLLVSAGQHYSIHLFSPQKQVKIISANIMIQNHIDGEKGHTEFTDTQSWKNEQKKCQLFRLLAKLKPCANNHKNITQKSHKHGTIFGNGTQDEI
jgi:hypothetical protein